MKTNKTPKVLLACPTSEHKDYCMPLFIAQLANITYDKDSLGILIIDNSENTNYWQKIVKEKEKYGSRLDNLDVIHYLNNKKTNIKQVIVDCHDMIKKIVLSANYDYWMSIESDIFTAPNIIEYLVSFKKPIIGLSYFIHYSFDSKLIAFAKEDFGIIRQSLMLRPDNAFINYINGEVRTAYQLGFGCILISRKILEKVNFRLGEEGEADAHDDTFFHEDLRKLGIPVFCDTSEIAYHMNEDWLFLNK
jgi:hypothetical protein